MSFRSSQRIQHVQTPVIPVIAQWLAAHPGAISLGQGVVHYAPPQQVGEAVVAASTDRRLGQYGFVRGSDDLLQEIDEKVGRENGISLGDGRSAIVTAGSNMGFLNSVLAVADVGDEVILLTPFYFNHEMAIEIAGCRAVCVATNENYQIDLSAIQTAVSPRTRAIVTVSPGNPTGVVSSRETLTAVNEFCAERGIFHISDEAYEYFVYGDEPHFSPGSLAASKPHTISLFSLSKAYAMAGWRAAYMVIPSHLESDVKKVQDTNLICPPIATQVAATAALRVGRGWCLEQAAGFCEVRDLVLNELSSLGNRLRVPRPDGAFYVLAELETDKPDMFLVESLIRDFGVAVLPGTTFGVTNRCALRIAYGALARETVAEGMGRLVDGLKTLV